LSSAFTIETFEAEPAMSRWKRSVTLAAGVDARRQHPALVGPLSDFHQVRPHRRRLETLGLGFDRCAGAARRVSRERPVAIVVSTETTERTVGEPITSRSESTPSFTELPLPLPI
jgi:hypothetical protein